MVDSSVGGKTGVDLPEGKNLVGAFKQPVAVCADTDALRTLPGSELNNGAAEMVKHGIIGPPELFHILEKDPERITDPSVIEDAIRVKISVVEADPLEQDVRAYLNLGHTVGHALEKCSDYGIAHGAAVAIGLCVVAELSSAMGFSGPDLPARIERLLTAIGLPTRHDFDSADLIAAMRMDKKSVSGTPKFVLIRDIGNVEHGVDAPEESLREALDKLRVRG
jgi:3-dehydroquinate synthetase